MKVTLLLCEHAAAAESKLFITGGGWNRVTTSGLVTVGGAGILQATAADVGEHSVRFALIDVARDELVTDGEGKPVAHEVLFVIREPPHPHGWPSNNPFAVNFVGLPLPGGNFRFEVSVDGEVEAFEEFVVAREVAELQADQAES